MAECIALVVAAGRGLRVGGDIPKQYRHVHGRPVLRRTLDRLSAHDGIDAVRVVIHPEDRALYDQATAGLSLLPPVEGGETRQDSVRLGLESLREENPARILIHDAARPFVNPETIDRVIDGLDHAAGCIAAVPVADTLKRIRDGAIGETVDRAGLWHAQTPQGFTYSAILAAHRATEGDSLTDDAAVAEKAGLTVRLVAGSEDNFKITSAADLARAERLVAGAPSLTRVGSGFDVHAFGAGDHVMLCGLRVDHTHGLVGHSDGDVGIHALVDGLLGAIAAGDIGTHFPPSDPQWRDADSARFLEHARDLVLKAGGEIGHVDLTLICEAPKIGPHRARMVSRLAEILRIEPGRVSVKATTTERLGFTGRGEGIAAQATVTLWTPR